MANRKGEKAGWVLGWLGGFLWVAVFAVIFLAQGRMVEGLLGLALTAAAVFCVFILAPWRHPSTKFAKLMIPLYAILFASAAWAISSFGGLKNSGLTWWNLFLFIPILIPLGTMGGKKWGKADPC